LAANEAVKISPRIRYSIMYFYQFNIEGYRKYTSHLSYLEHGIYRALIDTYYTHEQPLNPDKKALMRAHSIRSEEEKDAFTEILNEFFIETKEGYRHLQCDEALNEIYEKSEKARQSAKTRWDRKKQADELAKKHESDPENSSMEKLPLFDGIDENNANACLSDANALNPDANASETHANSMLPNTYNLGRTTEEKNTVSFDDFWKVFKTTYGAKGSKRKAEDQFKKVDHSIQQCLISIVTNQLQEKRRAQAENRFFPNFPHVERWLRDERWNDELDNNDNNPETEYLV